ncbi:Glycine zipper domain-containing protein [Candidatus Magnetomoraceae bacterium gMMP-15]
MKKLKVIIPILFIFIFLSACSKAYIATPVSFKSPSSYADSTEIAGMIVAAQAYTTSDEAKAFFGFDIHGAGIFPVQLIFDNQGKNRLEIVFDQTFLEDANGNLWEILTENLAYKRITKHTGTTEAVREGAKGGLIGAVAGSILGAAIGVATGNNVAASAGKGAALGGAAGVALGGTKGLNSEDAETDVINDFQKKSLEDRIIEPGGLTRGFLFFPNEASQGNLLRLKLRELSSGRIYHRNINLSN